MTALSKKYITFFSFCLIVLCHKAIACGPSLYLNEGRFSLFQNGLDGYNALEPFYFSETFLNSESPDPDGKDYKRNCEEWRKYCNNKVSVEDIFIMQYKTDADTFLRNISDHNWNVYKGNSYVQWLLQPNHKEALEYFILSKQIEFTQFSDYDPWREGPSPLIGKMAEYLSTSIRLCNTTRDKFLRERYAFQALKMEYYTYHNDTTPDFEPSALPLYKKYLMNSKSVVSGWAALFYGLRQTDANTRTYYLLKAFDLSEEKKVFCYRNISIADMDALLKVNKEPKVRETIYVLKAMNTYGRAFGWIKALYQLNPKSKYLPLLITREINKMEDWIWSPEWLHFTTLGEDENGKVMHSPYNRDNWYGDSSYRYFLKMNLKNDVAYLKNVRGFLEQIQVTNKRTEPFVQLAIAHLYNMTKEYRTALVCLNKTKDAKDKKIESQRIIEWSIASAYTHHVTNAGFKEQLYRKLEKLYSLNAAYILRDTSKSYWDYDSPESSAEDGDDFGELLLVLSNRFKMEGDIVTAGLLYAKANITRNIYDGYKDTGVCYYDIAYFDRNASVNDMDLLLKFSQKKNRTAFERFISTSLAVNNEVYKDLKGTILVRRQKFHEAEKVFKEMDENYWEENYQYKEYLPITTITSLGTLTPWEDQNPSRYKLHNKALIVKDITQIQDSLTYRNLSNAQKALLHYRLANCFYNITYFGKAWMMMSYGNSSAEEAGNDLGNYAYYSFYPNNLRYGKNYYHCEAAKREYKMAIQLSSDKELKASCLLNLALCEDEGSYEKEHSKLNVYLKQLSESYAHTATYTNALTNCPDITVE